MRPSRRNLFRPYLNLLTQYLISNLFSISSIVWSFSNHQFVCDDTNSVIVHWERMILSTHNLRCHITWSTTSISVVIRLYYPCNSEICDSDITLIIKHQILRFYITMYYIVKMKELQSNKNTSDEEFGLVLFESSSTSHMIAKITTYEQVHD